MQTTATLRYLRMSPRRVRVLARVIAGMDVARAQDQLTHIPRAAARPLQKLLASAIANAEQNLDLLGENLYIKTIEVNEGPTIHRSTPRAFGRATPIRRRSAHITVTFAERVDGKRGGRGRREEMAARRKGSKKGKTEKPEAHEHAEEPNAPATTEEHRKNASAPGRVAGRHHVEGAKERSGKSGEKKGGFVKRLFTRKTGGT